MDILKNIKTAEKILEHLSHGHQQTSDLPEDWLKQENNRELLNKLSNPDLLQRFDKETENYDIDKNWKAIESRIHTSRQLYIRKWCVAAASVAFLLGLGGTIFFHRQQSPFSPSLQQAGGVQLILDNGTAITLDQKTGDTIVHNQKIIAVTDTRQLAYTATENGKETEYNTLRVPKGFKYAVTLSDGTKIQLNSASELKYPVRFTGNERKVQLSGEAYLEVARDTTRPFQVETTGLKVKVYGTKFNINTHIKGLIQTVLVEGSVGIQILHQENEYRMQPGQLAEYHTESRQIEIKETDIQLYTGWIDGYFIFEEEALERVLDRMALWYNVDITYSVQELKTLRVSGSMKYFDDIRMILKAMETTMNVRFQIENKTIKVFPK